MIPEPRICYRALVARDRRFDGRFFVGVSSTRIYCRPVCPARQPKEAHCRFFISAAAAEVAGYRPCLRCRPELAPGRSSVDASARLAMAAAGWMDEGFDGSLDDLARRLEITGRHLRRVFREHFGVSPVAYSQTRRLLLAKQLLTETALPLIDVALAARFQSLRRFNALFKSRYGFAPARLRSQEKNAESVRFSLSYRPPFDWEGLLTFLERRTIPGVESVASGAYRRTVSLNGADGVVTVRLANRPGVLDVVMSASLLPCCGAVLERMKRLFDLAADPAEIGEALGDLASASPGMRVPGCFDGFEMAVRAILGQQVSVAAARTLAGRFAARFGRAGEWSECGGSGLTTLFPAPEAIAALSRETIASIGLVSKRAEAIRELARAIAAGRVALHPGEPLHRTLAALRQLPGVGEWTVQYIAMRALCWPDAFPDTDLGIRKAMGETSRPRILEQAEQWRPWRAYAVMALWKSLEDKND